MIIISLLFIFKNLRRQSRQPESHMMSMLSRAYDVISQVLTAQSSLHSYRAVKDVRKMFANKASFIIIGFPAFSDLHATVSSVDLIPFPEEPCLLHKGTTVNCTVTFAPDAYVTSCHLEVFGIISGIKVPFPLPPDQADACHNDNVDCPLKGGMKNELKMSLSVKPLYPPVQVIVQFGMTDENGMMLFCSSRLKS